MSVSRSAVSRSAITAATAAAALVLGATAASAEVVDAAKPVVTLGDAPTIFNSSAVDLVVDATDDVALQRIVGNIYQGSTLVKSTQSAASGVSGSHTVDLGSLTDGSYTLRYNASDATGKVATTKTFDFVVDNTAPTATVKPESVSSAGRYKTVSFKLFDAGKVDKVVLNGVVKDLSNSTWSDLNGVKPGVFGAIEGTNTLVVHDVAGNTATVTFVLDATGPAVTVKPESVGKDGHFSTVSFKLHDAALVDRVEINGVVKDLSNNVWSDVNGVKPGVFGAVEGVNTLVAYDVLGNSSTLTFTVDTVKPVLTLPTDVVLGAEPFTFAVTQEEANPARTYVEIQQLVNGKWKKLSGKEFTGTNTPTFTVDPVALGLQSGVATQLKVSTWDKVGHHSSATSAVTVS